MVNKILITCGAGKQSKVLTPILLKNGYKVRALFRSEETAEKLKQIFAPAGGEFEAVVGDLESKEDMKRVVTGVDVVFHMGPSMHPREDGIGKIVIDAAKAANISHFVMACVLHPIRTKLLHHRIKIAVDEYLLEARIPFTILQPTHFMQMTSCKDIANEGFMSSLWSFDTLQGYLDLEDYAEVLLNILKDPQHHDGATYELLGDNKTAREFAALISKHSGKEVKCEQMPLEVAQKIGFMFKGRSEYEEDSFARLVFYYNRWGSTGSKNILRFLLGREPTSVEDYVVRCLKV
jgi:uncharacterized protein YbjT (DUF2867 family)